MVTKNENQEWLDRSLVDLAQQGFLIVLRPVLCGALFCDLP